ncbi:MAG: hypothetical protein AABM64_17055 [Pseudomonadota bacterium]
MSRHRKRPDGLPHRVYERFGTRTYSIGFKGPDGAWRFRFKCSVTDAIAIARLRLAATLLTRGIEHDRPHGGSVADLIDAWFDRQQSLPHDCPSRRADTTLAENKREAENLRSAFGHLPVAALRRCDAYRYLDQSLLAKRPRAAKANKEISLMHTILEYGVRLGMLDANPFDGVTRLPIVARDIYVADEALSLTTEIGRRLGGSSLVVALALRTSFLCLRRSSEVRGLTRAQIGEAGIQWTATKRRNGHGCRSGLILWSDELRATIDEALAIKRPLVACSGFVFGNLKGQSYTRGGWKCALFKLVQACIVEAANRGIPFTPFNLQDCRPKGVTAKLERGDHDVLEATMHTSERMLRQVYDRRRVPIARPAM